MSLFLDSCVCIEFLRGRQPLVLEALRRTDPRLVKIPTIVEAELHLGAMKSSMPQTNARKIDLFLLPFEKIPFDSTCARTYAQIRAELESDGRLIGPNDLMIAAIVLASDGTLVTNNQNEFKRIRGLKLENWMETTI